MPGTRICRVLLGLPSSGKRYTAENRDWDGFYGQSKYTKIANNDLDYDFPLYWSQGYELVLIWNPAWVRDTENFNEMVSSAQSAGFVVEKEYFRNDTAQASCNAYNRWARKGDSKYYEFINNWINESTRDYDQVLISASASLGFEDGGGIPTTEVVPLGKDACKGGGGDEFEFPPICLFGRC